MSMRENVVGAAYLTSGSYLAYKGLEHGLPRALGIRTEYHITSKENAKLIKKANNILDPKFGGINGWSEKVKSGFYKKRSRGYIHITGFHPDSTIFKATQDQIHAKFPVKLANFISNAYKTFWRMSQCAMYKTVGNFPDFNTIHKMSKKEKICTILKTFKNALFTNKTKRFCVSGTDSYFTKNFIPDCDDVALKSTNPLKVYNNRFSAMFAGLKKFGLRDIKENKSRVAVGLSLIALSGFAGYKLIKKGIKKFALKNKTPFV